MPKSTPTFSISDLAKEFGVTTRTIRHYEELGLVKPSRAGQVRIYNRGDRTRLKLILRGKRLGFSLQESSDIIQLYDPSHNNREQLQQLAQKIQEQKSRLQHQLQDIHQMLQELETAELDCKQALKQARPRT